MQYIDATTGVLYEAEATTWLKRYASTHISRRVGQKRLSNEDVVA